MWYENNINDTHGCLYVLVIVDNESTSTSGESCGSINGGSTFCAQGTNAQKNFPEALFVNSTWFCVCNYAYGNHVTTKHNLEEKRHRCDLVRPWCLYNLCLIAHRTICSFLFVRQSCTDVFAVRSILLDSATLVHVYFLHSLTSDTYTTQTQS